MPGRRAWMIAFASCALAVMLVPAATSHGNALVKFPPNSAVLQTAPDQVWIDFSQRPDEAGLALQVFDAAGSRVDLADLHLNGTRAWVSLRPGLPDGGYKAEWQILTSDDGHVTNGAWTFAVGNATIAPLAVAAEPQPIPWALAAAKALAFLGLALVCGAVATRIWVQPRGPDTIADPRLPRIEQAGAALHCIGLVAFLGAQSSLAGLPPVEYVTTTSFGRGLAFRIALAVGLLVLAFAIRHRPSQALAWLGAALAAAAATVYGAFSHASGDLHPRALGVAVDSLHLGAVAAWTGGLAFLFVLLSNRSARPAQLVDASQRFSALATACVVVVGVTGVLMLGSVVGWDLRSWGDRLATPYGRAMAGKLALAAALLLLGAWSRFRLLRRFAGSPGVPQRKPLRRNVGREACLAFSVLALAGLATSLSPQATDMERSPLSATAVLSDCENAPEMVACITETLAGFQRTYGSDAAYQVLLDIGALDKTLGAQAHGIAHSLGEQALAYYGSIQSALVNCSILVQEGCLHGALRLYLAGEPDLQQAPIGEVCPQGTVRFNFQCRHGMGHGVLIAAGYDINVALGLCDKLPDTVARRDCHHGAFMENENAYIMTHLPLDHEGHWGAPKGLGDPNNLGYPCNAVDIEYRWTCWIFQGELIYFLTGNDYGAVSSVCQQQEPDYNIPCFFGLGSWVATNTKHEAVEAATICPQPASESRKFCVFGFISSTLLYYVEPLATIQHCFAFPTADQAWCFEALGFYASRHAGKEELENLCRKSIPHEAECRHGAALP